MHVPAFCDNCGAIFNSGIAITNSFNVTLIGNTSECPNCGNMARVLEGKFNFMNGIIEVISITKQGHYNLNQIASIIDKSIKREWTKQKTLFELEKKSKPIADSIKKSLPQNATEMQGYLKILLWAFVVLYGLTGHSCDTNNISDEIKKEILSVFK